MTEQNKEFRMPEIVEAYAQVIQEKGLTPYAAHKAAKMIYERLFIEPASPGKTWYNHDAAESFIPTLKLMSWKWFKALVKGRLPAFAELPCLTEYAEQDEEIVTCPRCSKPTSKVEIIYPAGWGEPETKVPAWLCSKCRYVFNDSDIEYLRKE